MIITILLLIATKLLTTHGDPLPSLGNIQFGSSRPPLIDPANALTSRTTGFTVHMNTEFGLILNQQSTRKSLYNYSHMTRLHYRIPNPSKAYHLAMTHSRQIFTKFQPHKLPYCQLDEDKSYRKYFKDHEATLDSAWSDEIQLTEIDHSNRHERQALIAASLGALLAYYSVYKYSHRKKAESLENNIQRQFTEFNSEYKRSEKRSIDVEVRNLDSIHQYFCSIKHQNYKVTNRAIADHSIDQYVHSLRHTIHNAVNDRMPTSYVSLKSLLALCLQLNSQSPLELPHIKSLCNEDIRTNLEPKFMGFELHDSDIIMNFDVKLFSYSAKQVQSVYFVNNLGYFSNSSRYTLSLPSLLYKLNNGSIVQINNDTDAIHRPEPVDSIRPTCAEPLFTHDKQALQNCLDQGTLRFDITPLDSCKYYSVSSTQFIVSGPGRYVKRTAIQSITKNAIVESGSFTCDIDDTKVSLNQLSTVEAVFDTVQLDSRLLRLVPSVPIPELTYPTLSNVTLEQPQVPIHYHINYTLVLILSIVVGFLIFVSIKMRGTITSLLKQIEKITQPVTNQNHLNRIRSKSMNDITTITIETPESRTDTQN